MVGQRIGQGAASLLTRRSDLLLFAGVQSQVNAQPEDMASNNCPRANKRDSPRDEVDHLSRHDNHLDHGLFGQEFGYALVSPRRCFVGRGIGLG